MCMPNSLRETLITQYVLTQPSNIGITWALVTGVESEALTTQSESAFYKILRGMCIHTGV